MKVLGREAVGSRERKGKGKGSEGSRERRVRRSLEVEQRTRVVMMRIWRKYRRGW
jgi:hypothetical protein